MNITTKQKIRQVVERLPEDTTIDGTIDALYLLQGVEIGLQQADQGQVIPHEQISTARTELSE